jgi:hypothetical protein
VAHDLLLALTDELEGAVVLAACRRDAADAGDPAATALFDRLERRRREDADQLRDFLAGRQLPEGFPPDFTLPANDDEVDS